MQRRTPEEEAERDRQRLEADAQRETQKRAEQAERERQAFLATPIGRARTAFEAGDSVFQYSIDVMSQKAIVAAMMGATTQQRTTDPSDVLNAVCREGWDLITGSFVFVEQGQESRDKFLASGQNVAIKGTTMGYYLFRRDEAARTASS